ncbi:hypothetical protein [Niallia circulans]|nr:hypothetical protein [Niallia circulans]NRG31496.1 hypothetical protein [Niallia circulans]
MGKRKIVSSNVSKEILKQFGELGKKSKSVKKIKIKNSRYSIDDFSK